MAETTFPGAANAIEDQWPWLVGVSGDGIVGDQTGGALPLTSSGSSPTVTISPGPGGVGVVRVAGFALVIDAAKTLNLSTVGTQPSTGQKRVDLIVARYDWSKALSAAATIEVHPGAPVPAGARFDDSIPAPTQTIGSVWEEPLYAVSRPAGGVVSAVASLRSHAVNLRSPSATAEVPLRGPVGTIDFRSDSIYRRFVNEDGTTEWRDVLAADRATARELARPLIRKATLTGLADGPINTTGTVLGGSTFDVPRPTAPHSRVLVELDVQGLGPNSAALVNTLLRLVVNGSPQAPETRLLAGTRTGRVVSEQALPAYSVVNDSVQLQTYMRALSAGGGVTIGPETTLVYKVTFS